MMLMIAGMMIFRWPSLCTALVLLRHCFNYFTVLFTLAAKKLLAFMIPFPRTQHMLVGLYRRSSNVDKQQSCASCPLKICTSDLGSEDNGNRIGDGGVDVCVSCAFEKNTDGLTASVDLDRIFTLHNDHHLWAMLRFDVFWFFSVLLISKSDRVKTAALCSQ